MESEYNRRRQMTLTPRSTEEAQAITVKLSTKYDLLPPGQFIVFCLYIIYFSYFFVDSHEMAN